MIKDRLRFVDLLHPGLYIPPAPYLIVHNHPSIDAYVNNLGSKFKKVNLGIAGLAIIYEDRPDRTIFTDGELIGHDNSKSEYYFDRWFNGDTVHMLNKLEAGRNTSIHDHPPQIYEFYKVLAGKVKLHVGQSELELTGRLEDYPLNAKDVKLLFEGNHPDRSIYLIPPETKHYMVAARLSLIGIRMIGAAYLPPEQWHRKIIVK